MTRRLYYDDAYLARFQARIVDRGCDPCEVYLDQTAFYPTSGGQPYDTGTVNGVRVIDVLETGNRILHRLARPVNEERAECEIDFARRFDHMQQHSGQHLLSAVFSALHGLDTAGFHLGAAVSTIDLDAPSVTLEQVRAAEDRANRVVFENRPVSISYEDAAGAAGLRKEPGREGTLRIVSIRDLDRSACGGTHVRSTGEIGPVLVRKIEKIRGTVRVEFLCGLRAIRRAREDYDTLAAAARVFSAALDDLPALVAAQQEKLAAADKDRQRLARELARMRGHELYRQTAVRPDGLRFSIRELAGNPSPDELRSEAQGFAEGPRAVFLAVIADPPSVLLAASADAGIHAGNLLKETVASLGGRGGGNAQLAQGSLPSAEALRAAAARLGL